MISQHGHIDDDESTLGTHVNFSHAAPTVPGSTVTVDVKLIAVERRALTFEIEARDEHAIISTGTHQRGVVNRERFESRLRSEEHTSELQSRFDLVCRLLLDKTYI